MQPFISTRRDCFYSDTDSLVISEPLPNELVSSTKLGYFKLEHRIKRGIFLASYALQLEDNNYIIKHKGMAKAHVTFDWFERQLLDPKDITIQNPFRIMWSNLTMRQVETRIRLRILSGTKRDLVYDDNGKWIGTKPIKIIDLGNPEQTALMKSTEERMTELREENLRLRNLLLQGDKDKGESQKGDPANKERNEEDTRGVHTWVFVPWRILCHKIIHLFEQRKEEGGLKWPS